MKTGFPDLPLDPHVDLDLLGLDPHAAALASFVNMCSTPMTIGVQGDWGSGKTSLMNLIKAKLGDENVLNIWFNTWQYSQFGNDERLASSMLINLMQKIKNRGEPSKKVWHNVSRFIRAVAQATNIGAPGVAVGGQSLVDAFDGRGDLDEAGVFEQMKGDFSEVVKDILENEAKSFDRIIIYIDDLDRLSPAKAVEILEAMKNLIDVEGCVFILAIDYEVVIRGLRQRKGVAVESARDNEGKNFFDKIIQVPYRMPVERYKTRHFLQDQFERVYGELSDEARSFFEEYANALIRHSVGNNPRALKRVLNIHSLFSHLMKIGSEREESENERLITLVLACIQVSLPGVYSMLAKHDDPFQTLFVLNNGEVYDLAFSGDFSSATALADLANQIYRDIKEACTETGADDEGSDEDDPGGILARLRSITRDIRRLAVGSEEEQRTFTERVKGLAEIALSAIDANGDGVYSPDELETLESAFQVAKSTSVETEDVEPEIRRTRRHVGFKELADLHPTFADYPTLVFYDPEHDEIDPNYMRAPDYDRESSRLYVTVDGEPVSLKAETLRVLETRAARGIREQTTTEEAGRIRAALYWIVEGDPEQRSLVDLIEEWKTMWAGEVDMRTPTGRNAFDTRVLAHLKSNSGEYVTATSVREAVGGTSVQVRAALNRLIEAEAVTWRGKARGTRYCVA